MKKVISIPGAPAPIGPYSQAIVKNDSLFVSGQIPLNPQSGELVLDSISEATKQVMENIVSLVQSAEFKMTDIVKCSIFLKSMDNFAEVNAVYSSYFPEVPPARETVQVSKLPMDVPVEISCIALK
ncbi:MAG: Rid family detoxifying hydrolase [Crocinitomicaceae bacterium]|jgi:2-iminobutanoate/2-iminopropanoate deaminase|nr:Rid family detoxifying hydrolase [Crocinitomicaceae bacterium]MDG2463989.1 Rid family detoxifying hydrolase [Crocinitomicaceae bacterium]